MLKAKNPSQYIYRISNIAMFLFVLFFCTIAGAQMQTAGGTLTGEVKDPDGGALPGAMVTVTGAGGTKTSYTDSAGKFSIPNVAPGMYDVTAELAGFVTITKTDVQVQAGANSADFTLRPGGLAEQMVVTASKVETPLINAPATMSVINTQTIESSSAQNYADLLRSVPGLNVTQTSARDINLTSRQANSTLATSQLALLDGRTIYLDFFGFIAWDFLPVNFDEIKQVEVIRGPASAVWGANAQTGVVNIITKSPREAPGASVVVSGGTFDRSVDNGPDLGNGTSYSANVRFAQVVNDKISYKLSGGYYNSDPWARPVGIIPVCSVGPDVEFNCPPLIVAGATLTGGAPYALAGYVNQGTSQPKFDARVDQEINDETRIVYSGGVAGTDGIIHTGIGPFDIQSGTFLGYGKVGYTKDNLKLNFFANFLDGDAINQFGAVGPTGPIDLIFKNQTYDFEGGDSMLLGDRNILTFGGNYRRNNFDISIAPNADPRNEVGGYVQDEFFTDKFRLVIGGRVDKFSVIDSAVFSPRVTFMFKPTQENSLRVSFNRAFRSPSTINNFLNTAIINAFNLGVLNPALNGILFAFPTLAIGNPNLKEESTTAYEVGYTGEFNGRTTVGVSYYVNDNDNNINFTAAGTYTALPPGSICLAPTGQPIPCPVDITPFLPLLRLPSLFTYLNLGPTRQQGIELSFDQIVNSWVNVYANYSFQKTPEILNNNDGPDFPVTEIIFPPKHRFNAGVGFNSRRYIGSFSVNYQSEAFWSDVLDARFFGPTDSFTMLNGSFGVKWMDGRITTTVKVNNIANEQIQQHIFGDILKRSVNFEAKFDF
jgi:iron complex outermembrane receptor protein